MVPKTSIILTYQHSRERETLFYACLANLTSLTDNSIEICVHEVGPERILDLSPKYKYLYTYYEGVYHRAWALNRCVRELSTGEMLVLMDSDLIVSPAWVQEILSCTKPSIAWGQLKLINEEGTKSYIGSRYINNLNVYKIKTPSMGGAAGGIAIIPRKLFYTICGIPEDFMGSWGGEDNAFWAKLVHLGNKVGKFKSTIYHLHHSPSTPRITAIQRKVVPMLLWKSKQWNKYINLVGNSWGAKDPESYISPGVDIIAQSSGIKLTIAMLSWLRYDKLINTLQSLYETLTIPINLCLMVQGEEKLSNKQKREIHTLANKFEGCDLFYSKGNMGTGPARKLLSKRALTRFNTPYINLGDDDTTYTIGSVEAIIDLLDKDRTIGVAGIRYKSKVYRLNNLFHPIDLLPSEATNQIQEVECTGSASAFIRREVFNLCQIDDFYIIGFWDIDLFLQVKQVGWRIVNYKAFDSMQAINNWGGSIEYRKARTHKKRILIGRKHFKSTWNLGRTI